MDDVNWHDTPADWDEIEKPISLAERLKHYGEDEDDDSE